MSLQYLITSLFDDRGDTFCFADLEQPDKDRLTAAAFHEVHGLIFDVFAGVHEATFEDHFAHLSQSVGSCDVFHLAEDLRIAITHSKDVESAIDAEIDRLWPSYEAEKREEAAEQFHDSMREAI